MFDMIINSQSIERNFCKSFALQYFKENPDYNNPAYNTKLGIYSEGCGLENVLMSWGHDDYMYMVYPLTFIEFLMKNL